ncbi:MAG: hypothetical protein ACOYT9_00825 [Patescibacteria group bacterium]|jgi:hypothetical protein
MKQLLRKIALIGVVLSLLIPLIMAFLWVKYVREQEYLVSSDNTVKQPCEPSQFTIDTDDVGRMKITWETREACTGFILLGKSYADFSSLPYKVLSANGESPSTSHSVSLLKQDELSYRYVIVVSEGEWYGINGNPFQLR